MNLNRNTALSIIALACTSLLAQRPDPVPNGPRGGGNGPSAGAGFSAMQRADPMADAHNPRGGPSAAGGQPYGRAGMRVMPIRPHGAPTVTRIDYFRASPRVVVPPEWWPRCTVMPDMAFWGHRDLFAEIQWLSRAGFIPITPVDPSVDSLQDYAFWPAGWKAYGFAVPPGGKLQVEVQHEKPAWFRLMAVDKWGKPGPGMLQAAIAYRPTMVTLTNPGKEANAVYVIVDDPGWWSSKEDPYTVVVRRDWDPSQVDLKSVKMVAGIWGASPSNSAEFRGPSLTGPAVFPH